MKKLAAAPSTEFSLIVMSGSDKGANYKIVGGKVTVGRGESNDIVLSDDPKASRQHAVIRITPDGPLLQNLSETNKVFVNGKETIKVFIKAKDLIQIGETKFQFQEYDRGYSLTPVLSEVKLPKLKSIRPNSNSLKKMPPMRIAIIGLVIFALFGLIFQSTNKKSVRGLPTEEQINMTIDANQKLADDLIQQKKDAGQKSIQYEEAQSQFVKGFRDYQKGQYERAAESFSACLSLYSQQLQCQRYLVLAKKKFAELYQYHILQGRRYKEQGQFDSCLASFRNAMVMIKDPSNISYQEAKAGYAACEALKGERF